MPQLELQNLTVRFGGLTAVCGLSCAVDEGRIFSIIGPNGAGKTTVFNAITGIYEPTEGSVRFEGRELRRAFTWRVAIFCALVGLLTGMAAALATANVDNLWNAAIKRNYLDPTQPFSWAKAWQGAWGYLRGDLAVEPVRGGRWSVVSADGRQTLGYADSDFDAQLLRDNLARMIGLNGSDRTLVHEDQQWIVREEPSQGSDMGDNLGIFDSAEAARAQLEKMARLGREAAARRRDMWLALVLGIALGSSGAYAVWNRSRRTPDVIARSGIARTFQNIRLFQNMTALENVLTAMDRAFSAGVGRMALRSGEVRRQEAAGRAEALKLLDFVSLAQQAPLLAKNLPYGDQRRLEIARALASGPRLILLDEPAAGMNPTESAELTRLIDKIRRQGITVLLIEHHMKVVMGISDRIAVLDYGAKIAEGTPEEVRANPEVIRAYLGSEEVT